MSTQIESTGFLGALFDFSFSNFITGRLIKILFALGLLAWGLTALSILLAAFQRGFLTGILGLIFAPLVFLLGAMYLRVVLEIFMVIFRIAENVQRIADRP
jgi:hypothetical protein